MLTFEWIIGLLLAAVALSALARRIKVPYPTFLALGGVLLTLLPWAPTWALEPKLALALFVAPVLLDAAFDTSLRDLRNNWLPVSTLVVVAVGVTTAAVAVVAHWLRPDMPWAVAIALGAIVAPPDAAAATAILRQVNLPYRIQKILEGESLLNDASALLIYRVAVGLVAAEHMKIREFVPSITIALVGSLAAGFTFAQVWMMITRRITEAPSAIITQFGGTFMVWIIAEHLGLSGILTIIAYAITISRTAPARTSARLRVSSYAVWETVVFVLNVLAFMLIGLQLRPIWSGLDDEVRWKYCSFAAAILAVVILARILWVMPYGALLRTLKTRNLLPAHVVDAVPTLKRGFIVSWCGMRGIVTLAAAFALPEWFPYRDLILLTAFAVVLGSLVIQGLTLRPLILALNFADDDPVGREAAHARGVVFRAALDEIDADPSEEAEILRLEYRAVLLRAENDPDGGLTSRELPSDPLRRRAIAAARQALLNLRRIEAIGDDAFHLVEEELDRAELSVEA
ncbi:CPA1 family monovalent cation:H+ antiporter [Bradyrhizobium sp. USDA 4538]|uniref:cation:proton antiporter n=1 Tax=unclassified Bradyrhizobium TaxID=2631580 RepID=UPI00209CCD68|nr:MULTISPECIES: sodium:proton antiporter [unclassified Bradyrhizobium]MCP1839615.1 CPA1 family monovalent cation:H+ antiporter [Bradyrhizobium sp. USDA 4538]MCP1900178.1 CPA1 family monovalent cation:H+ antiporter [Bradyrhizobium sp. USDA 4537]MCP1994167.1 CPA1 family monovalent cation:H+ antiporter [Bradyrhizobium sp. USDA 4539]